MWHTNGRADTSPDLGAELRASYPLSALTYLRVVQVSLLLAATHSSLPADTCVSVHPLPTA